MHDVILKYRPIPWFPYRKEIETTHPENWKELTQFQFEEVVEFLNKTKKTENDVVYLINILLSLKKPLTNFPLEISELPEFLNDKKYFSCWIIQTINIDNYTLAGPHDHFKNVTIGQFAFADTFFIQYFRDKHEQILNKLIASLYFPGAIFNPDNLDVDVIRISRLPSKTKAAIFFNYTIMRMWIMEKYSYVFPKQSEDPQHDRRGKKERKPHSTWRAFLRNLVNRDYVHEDKILNTLMHTVLYDHNETIKEQKTKKK